MIISRNKKHVSQLKNGNLWGVEYAMPFMTIGSSSRKLRRSN